MVQSKTQKPVVKKKVAAKKMTRRHAALKTKANASSPKITGVDPTQDMLSSIHKTMSKMHEIGVADKQTLAKFDDLCLPEIRIFQSEEIKALREKLGVSQPVFARYLNTTKSTVSKWEQGDKNPTGIAQKLLNLVADKGLQVLA
jgi:putative transcriptional regulator